MIKTIFLSMVGCCGSGTSAPTLATDLKPGQVYLIFESQARYIYLFPKVRLGTYIFSKARSGTFFLKPGTYIFSKARPGTLYFKPGTYVFSKVKSGTFYFEKSCQVHIYFRKSGQVHFILKSHARYI